jgi:hypothetical protein
MSDGPRDIVALVTEPREDLSTEFKDWLDLRNVRDRGTLAKAAIALANHGGGFIVIGFREPSLESHECPPDIHDITQDVINSAIRKFATPEFHCEMNMVQHPRTGVNHPVISVPGTLTEPVMSKSACEGVIAQNRCYIRKPGPRSEEPQKSEEWRVLLRRCVRASRDDLLDAMRAIVEGGIELDTTASDPLKHLEEFCHAAHGRWEGLVHEEAAESPSRFPHGYYEMGFCLVDAVPQENRSDLRQRLEQAGSTTLTGWPPFGIRGEEAWRPYPFEDCLEAWIGRPASGNRSDRTADLCDFWRASLAGELYTIRGYTEDDVHWRQHQPGRVIDVVLPIWRIAEGLLFASRMVEGYNGTDEIAILCRFTGLEERRLISDKYAILPNTSSRAPEVAVRGQAHVRVFRDNLPEVVHKLLWPLYELFNFFELPLDLVQKEVGCLRR